MSAAISAAVNTAVNFTERKFQHSNYHTLSGLGGGAALWTARRPAPLARSYSRTSRGVEPLSPK